MGKAEKKADETAVATVSQAVASVGEAVIKLDLAAMSVSLAGFTDAAERAAGQNARAVVDSEESCAKAGELVKAITTTLKDVEDTRKTYTVPLDAAKRQIMDVFEVPTGVLREAKNHLSAKQSVWMQAEQKRRNDEAIAQRQRAEEEARRQADALADAGDIEQAALAAEAADALASRPVEPTRTSYVGSYGTTTSGTRVVSGEVTSPREFLTALLSSTLLGEVVGLSDIVEFKKSGINKLAKSLADRKAQIPGLSINDRMEARSR